MLRVEALLHPVWHGGEHAKYRKIGVQIVRAIEAVSSIYQGIPTHIKLHFRGRDDVFFSCLSFILRLNNTGSFLHFVLESTNVHLW